MSKFFSFGPTVMSLNPLTRVLAAAGVLSALPWASVAQSLPVGAATPVIGQATVVTGRDQVGPTMNIEQSSKLAVFRWDSFNVAAGATVSHVMAKPNSQALTVHHVYDLKAGPSLSTISGTVLSDHRVFLISSGGIRVASGAVIEAPSLLMSSHELDAKQFANGSYSGLAASDTLRLVPAANSNGYDNGVLIEANARLRTSENGGLALLGGQVQMGGLIQSGAGAKVLLAASAGAEVPLTDSGFLTLNVQHGQGNVANYVSMYGQVEGAGSSRPGEVVLESGAGMYMGPGASITSVQGAVNVTLQSAMSDGGQGEMYLAGYSYSDNYALASASAVSAAVPPPSGAVNIRTGGGSFKISGSQGAGAKGIWMSNVNLDAEGGQVDLLSRRDQSSEGGNAAVTIQQSQIKGGAVAIRGYGAGGDVNGVSMVNTTIRSASGIDIRGVATGAGLYGGIGLDLLQSTFHGGAKGVELYGRGQNQGVRFSDLTLTSNTTESGGRFVLVGQTLAGDLPGIGLDPEFGGRLRIQDEQGRASPADLIIGGLGGPQSLMAIDLGQGESRPVLNLSGRYNLRPLGVNDAGQVQESFDTPIVLGQDDRAETGRMVLLPEWFNAAAAPDDVGLMSVVIGSRGHRGLISSADGALNGMAELTLQNQGAQSQGIRLGGASKLGTLNLVSGGQITQSGPIEVESLRVVVPEGVSVNLTDGRNQIKSLAYRGVGESAFGGSITPSSNARAGISAFNPDVTNGQFETIIVERTMPESPVVEKPALAVDTETQGERVLIPSVLEEQRSDVYVRDAFNKPQVCTGASTMAASVLTDAGVEPLTLEWLKVRQSPQLSSCSGARVNASCSVF